MIDIASLTEAQLKFLKRGLDRPFHIVQIEGPRGLRYAVQKRMAERLERAGYLTANAHGDWYLSDEAAALLTVGA